MAKLPYFAEFKLKPLLILCLLLAVVLSAGCTGVESGTGTGQGAGFELGERKQVPSPVEKIPPEERTTYDLLVLGARQEVANGVMYDASYETIAYPGGDVSPDRGACTDVVVRAFRNADIDLQQLIYEDMKVNFNLYPQEWGLNGPDPNIDHRRVPNQMKFFERFGESLPLSTDEDKLDQWQWGDVVYWKFSNGLDHCGIVSDRKNEEGIPLAIHNAGMAREEDCLTRWEITGHFRYPAE